MEDISVNFIDIYVMSVLEPGKDTKLILNLKLQEYATWQE